MAFLELHGLSRMFGSVVAVENINIDVAKGEFVSLLGPSGCGKTTTLNMIAGFLEPSSGRIRLDGTMLDQIRPCDRGLGVVFQNYALFPHMTVAENVAFGLEMKRVPQQEANRRVADILELVRLDGLAARYPAQLSGGQQQRVAVARALVIEPPLLLLDEPLSNLDAKLREEMQVELRRIQRTVGTTTIMVTHDQAEAMALSDRIAVMNRGRLEQTGSPQDVYDRPVTAFVSSFLGKTNLLQARLFKNDRDVCRIDIAGHCFSIAGSQCSGFADGTVQVSLRPERIRVVTGRAAGAASVAGQIRSRVFLGDRWVYEIESALGPLLVHQPNSSTTVAEGDAVALAWDTSDLRIVEAGHA
ncbi:ABC transporter ATP-binding protein [Nitratireductor thuwali]|uniref:Spermidine/putrescine import ATP-binding protein PotA n=1 Tax=Nitratireductor thuwali TaxID=2267699 RepID=A0ABY5MR98_9HYPH|nr:Spermidine/putrescine import ATP-binding protein PotA [Nitratireductor thuwali]